MCICIQCVYTLFCLKYKKKKFIFTQTYNQKNDVVIYYSLFKLYWYYYLMLSKSSKRYCYLNTYLQCGLWNLSFLNLKLKPIGPVPCTGREVEKEWGKGKKERRKRREGVRKEGKKKATGLPTIQYKDVCGFLS